MNKTLQVLSYLVSFLLVLCVGYLFECLFPGEFLKVQHELPGRSLPGAYEFLNQNISIVHYLFLFPWLGFVGLPLLVPARIPYWDTNLFLLRFSIFLPLELLLLVFISFVCYLPYVTLLDGMSEGPGPPPTLIETSVSAAFWFCVALLAVVAIWRSAKRSKPKD